MQIHALPLLNDNYGWLLIAEDSSQCAVVDPSESAPVRREIKKRGLQLKTILVTHHHPDHIGGVKELAEPGVEVVCSAYDKDRVPAVTRTVDDGDTLTVLGEPVTCMMVPGHTLGAVAFFFGDVPAVFTGDTLFLAGCGRLFEGTPAQMYASLTKLGKLPPATNVYCGHEYTEKNLRFAISLEPDNPQIRERLGAVTKKRQHHHPTVPETLAVELATNPFLRTHAPELQAVAKQKDGVAVLTYLRKKRDTF